MAEKSQSAKVQGVWSHQGTQEWQRTRKSGFGSWWFLPLGLLGPVLGSIIGIVLIIFGLWALKFINILFQSALIALFISSVSANLHYFFAFSLFAGFCEYFIRRSYFSYLILWPISTAASFAFSAWVLAWIFRAIGTFSNASMLYGVGAFLRLNLAGIFLAALALGFIFVGMGHFFPRPK
jgi:hypothetical protein